MLSTCAAAKRCSKKRKKVGKAGGDDGDYKGEFVALVACGLVLISGASRMLTFTSLTLHHRE